MRHEAEKYKNFILEGGCPAKVSEDVEVTVPICVHAFVDIEDAYLGCKGSAVVTEGWDKVHGHPDKVKKFTVCQRIHIDIPLVFGAEADVGEGHVNFDFDDKDPPCNHKCKD